MGSLRFLISMISWKFLALQVETMRLIAMMPKLQRPHLQQLQPPPQLQQNQPQLLHLPQQQLQPQPPHPQQNQQQLMNSEVSQQRRQAEWMSQKSYFLMKPSTAETKSSQTEFMLEE